MKAPILALAALIAVSGCALKKKEGYWSPMRPMTRT